MESYSDTADAAPTTTAAEDEALLRQLQLQLTHASAATDEAMHESRRKLEHLMNPSSTWRRGDIPPLFSPTAQLLRELDALTEPTTDATADWTDPHDQPLLHHRSELHRREAQSALYRNWRNDRAHMIASLPAARDQHALRQAQHSMQRFQQTLAAVQQRGT